MHHSPPATRVRSAEGWRSAHGGTHCCNVSKASSAQASTFLQQAPQASTCRCSTLLAASGSSRFATSKAAWQPNDRKSALRRRSRVSPPSTATVSLPAVASQLHEITNQASTCAPLQSGMAVGALDETAVASNDSISLQRASCHASGSSLSSNGISVPSQGLAGQPYTTRQAAARPSTSIGKKSVWKSRRKRSASPVSAIPNLAAGNPIEPMPASSTPCQAPAEGQPVPQRVLHHRCSGPRAPAGATTEAAALPTSAQQQHSTPQEPSLPFAQHAEGAGAQSSRQLCAWLDAANMDWHASRPVLLCFRQAPDNSYDVYEVPDVGVQMDDDLHQAMQSQPLEQQPRFVGCIPPQLQIRFSPRFRSHGSNTSGRAWFCFSLISQGEYHHDDHETMFPNLLRSASVDEGRVVRMHNARNVLDVAQWLSEPSPQRVQEHLVNISRLQTATERFYSPRRCYELLVRHWGERKLHDVGMNAAQALSTVQAVRRGELTTQSVQ